MPDMEPEEAKNYYRTTAKFLCDALVESLPGGTLDALLVELMSRKVSLLRVPIAS